ncbi:cobalamin B12-binding domain-containing protein [Micromonospora sp. PSH03]|jgi:methylaspartate mutase sigma subunit|uniref:cobalamin B12-binding domain-containing protein n=1 Tax=Micromonospora TaxID=1873 RepID=UPI001B387E39|nr:MULTISPECIES: cobalamin B12-binding domain-containing protein [Micromonospora]MBQ0988761.1 cobalamin B12-binding domain-containing protein [Micromonospora sp. H61]MCG5454690.1 cobalamin B12-binding domain-containing protein [Micromonospora salmantinae]
MNVYETGGTRPTALLAGPPSDAHTWNLLYLQLLMTELGWQVSNLGPCTPVRLLVAESARCAPDLVVISTVNGHGYHEGLTLIRSLRREAHLRDTPIVVGGKLGIDGPDDGSRLKRLRDAGYDDVFDGDGQVPRFQVLLDSLRHHARRQASPAPAVR